MCNAFGMECHSEAGYPGWDPDRNSELLAHGVDLHSRMFNFEPEIKAIHAGLECGILKGKMPNVDMLSFGPTIALVALKKIIGSGGTFCPVSSA